MGNAEAYRQIALKTMRTGLVKLKRFAMPSAKHRIMLSMPALFPNHQQLSFFHRVYVLKKHVVAGCGSLIGPCAELLYSCIDGARYSGVVGYPADNAQPALTASSLDSMYEPLPVDA